jgi:hypothetical protein
MKSVPIDAFDEQRFWAKVHRGGEDDCWEWQAGTDDDGYGKFSILHVNYQAHRISYVLANGEPPRDSLVCHTCDNPPCVNPKHLFPGSHADNHADRNAKNRTARGDTNGACLHPERLPHGDDHWTRRHPERVKRGDQNPSRQHSDRLARGDRNGSRLHPESRPRGEQNSRAKLTKAQVQAIRDRFAQGGATKQALADEYGVSRTAIRYIIEGRNWAP